MKVYQGKTPEDALKAASEELGKPVEDLIYKVEDKRVGIFNKKYVVDVYELSDIITYAEDYILHVTCHYFPAYFGPLCRLDKSDRSPYVL